jgi:hypothetical protein
MSDNLNSRQRVASGVRLTQVKEFLHQEMVGDELLFTAEHAQRASEQLGMRDTEVWTTIATLDRKGVLKKRQNRQGRGFFVSFDVDRNERHNTVTINQGSDQGKQISVSELLVKIDSDIDRLKAQIQKLKVDIGCRVDLRNQIKTLIGR